MEKSSLASVLICSITPYFLERRNFWFEKNLKKILRARSSQAFWQNNTLFLEAGQSRGLSQTLRELDEMGYEKVLRVSEPGEFSRQGGIIEVFPVNLNCAVRLDFYGNSLKKIEKLPLEIENEEISRKVLKNKLRSQKVFSDLKGLKPGDYLVHLDHGVGRFARLSGRFYLLEYAQGDKLYVPLGLERKLSRYVGFAEPKISRLSSPSWQRTKRKIKEETEKLARELLEIYAKREISRREPYASNPEIDRYLKETFLFEETPDQARAMAEIEKDLRKREPMDRIVCGDVGFGKTEIALRTLVKAVNAGYQAAMICPTTILANQHYQNFKQRLGRLPFEIKLLSRLQPKAEQRKTLRETKEGKTDILIGTHRVLSSDLEFKNLGMLVIDDEQRFGVSQKEKLKKIRSSLDVLSLSATPIPRTLYLALSSLKEISLIQTPPAGRSSIKTFVLPRSDSAIKKAIRNELGRGGQVYFLHNRIETIETARKSLEALVKNVKIGVAHGRLSEKNLIKVMEEFQNKKIDLLLATTIIENGLDLPNVNTLIVADAARLGLSQAYQIRGRIGRSYTRAFAYFFYGDHLSEKARERLSALKKAEELGSGYRIALKDLELRGAGNVLGKEQSGSINRVGLNLYCQMLSSEIEKIKKG